MISNRSLLLKLSYGYKRGVLLYNLQGEAKMRDIFADLVFFFQSSWLYYFDYFWIFLFFKSVKKNRDILVIEKNSVNKKVANYELMTESQF